MKPVEPEQSLAVPQLLRYALSLDLSVAYASDGTSIISKGRSVSAALNSPFCEMDDFVASDFSEDSMFEDGQHHIEYWAKWSVADDYPDLHNQNWKNWAWEFLRRNEQYALLVEWMNRLPEGIRLREKAETGDLLEHVLCEPAPLAGQRTVGDYVAYCEANDIDAVIVMPILVLRYCWRVNWPLRPYDEIFDLSDEQQASFFLMNKQKIFSQDYLIKDIWLPEFPFQEVKIIFSSKEVLFKFDLSEPLSGQLEEAFKQLKYLREIYFKKTCLEIIAPDDLSPLELLDDLDKIADPKNYTKALQFKLRIFDAVNMNGGFLSEKLCISIIEIFENEMTAKEYEDFQDFLPKTINAKIIKKWYFEASKIVNGNYKTLALKKLVQD